MPSIENINLLKTDTDGLTEEQWLEMIATRVQWFLDNDLNLLLSYMYRLDIEESSINHALSLGQNDPPHILLARIILARQKERAASKSTYKVDPIEGWEY